MFGFDQRFPIDYFLKKDSLRRCYQRGKAFWLEEARMALANNQPRRNEGDEGSFGA